MADTKLVDNFTNKTTGDKIEICDTEARTLAEQNASEITDLNETLTELNSELSDFVPTKVYMASATVESMLADFNELPNQRPGLFVAYQECAQFLTNSSTTGIWAGIIYRNGTNCNYLLCDVTYGIYLGRVSLSDSTINRLILITGQSVL